MKVILSPAVEQELDDVLLTINLSKSALIDLAIMRFLSEKDNFIICPRCDSYLAVCSAIDSDKPVKRYRCECGTIVWYATREGYVIDSEEKPHR